MLVAPSAVEVAQVESLCNLAGERPCVLLNPQLEDIYTVGIGMAARKLRERLLSTIEPCYYLRPIDPAAILRSYPGLWQVWLEIDDEYQLIAEEPQRPAGDALDQILAKAMGSSEAGEGETTPSPVKFILAKTTFAGA